MTRDCHPSHHAWHARQTEESRGALPVRPGVLHRHWCSGAQHAQSAIPMRRCVQPRCQASAPQRLDRHRTPTVDQGATLAESAAMEARPGEKQRPREPEQIERHLPKGQWRWQLRGKFHHRLGAALHRRRAGIASNRRAIAQTQWDLRWRGWRPRMTLLQGRASAHVGAP